MVGHAFWIQRLLIGCGDDKGRAEDILGQCQRLVDPEQMGHSYKCMALTHNMPGDDPPTGFEVHNLYSK